MDCTVASQMVGRLPVKPTSGKAGRPEPNESEGTKASRLWARPDSALSRSDCASFTFELLLCASSTTVRSDTCACDEAAADASAISITPRASRAYNFGTSKMRAVLISASLPSAGTRAPAPGPRLRRAALLRYCQAAVATQPAG